MTNRILYDKLLEKQNEGVTTQVSEPQISETQSVVNAENSVPITLKVKLPKDVDLNRNEQKNTEPKNQTYVAESPITKQEPQPKQKETVAFQKHVEKTGKTLFEKFKIPIFVVAGILILWGGFTLAKRYKYIFSKSDVEDSRTYEDNLSVCGLSVLHVITPKTISKAGTKRI
jgi:hypothetical protein